MNKSEIISFKEKYNYFKKELEHNILLKEILLYNKECYLIKKSWLDEFIEEVNHYDENGNNSKSEYSKINSVISLPKNNPEIINNISSVIELLNNGCEFKLVNKELIEFIFINNKDELRRNNYIYYYTGNNRIIMEFKARNEYYALLFFGPLKINRKNVYLISRTNSERNNKVFYKIILNSFYPSLINNEQYKNKIKAFDDFINNGDKSIQSIENEKEQSFPNIRIYNENNSNEREEGTSKVKRIYIDKDNNKREKSNRMKPLMRDDNIYNQILINKTNPNIIINRSKDKLIPNEPNNKLDNLKKREISLAQKN